MGYSREYITEQLQAFEMLHAVDKYVVRETAVWPLIRISIATAVHAGILPPRKPAKSIGDSPPPPTILDHCRHIYGQNKRKALYVINRLKLRLKIDGNKHLARVPKADVVIVTAANRRITLNGSTYHIIVDPLRELLETYHFKPLIWERGSKSEQMIGFPSWQDANEQLKFGLVPDRFAGRLEKPEWFLCIQKWALEAFSVELAWDLIEWYLRRMFYFSDIARAWLKKTECKLVVTDCWYNQDCFAFIQAASELGLKTVDFQHGLQGSGHFAYQGWIKIPEQRYSLIPKKFWVWGLSDKQKLINGGIQGVSENEIVVGGNLWLNKWVNNDAEIYKDYHKICKNMIDQNAVVIVVTLQKDIDNRDLIRSAIQKSSKDWKWLIRVHRNEVKKIDDYQSFFQECSHPGINFESANCLPLYLLFQVAHVHITGYSTCALEAIAFKLPSILVHQSGKLIYDTYIKSGLMSFADSSLEIINGINKFVKNKNSLNFTDKLNELFNKNTDYNEIFSNLLNT